MSIRYLPSFIHPSEGFPFSDLLDFGPPFTHYPSRRGQRPFAWSRGSHSWPSYGFQSGFDEAEKFSVSIDVSNFSPDDVTVRIEDDKLIIHGRNDHRSNGSFELYEFQRFYQLPDNMDPNSLTSRFSSDGVLQVEATKIKSLEGRDYISGGGFKAKDGYYTTTINAENYRPEDIIVKINGRQLYVRGKQQAHGSTESGDRRQVREFYRSFQIPRDGNVDDIQPRMQPDGKLVIKVPRGASFEPQERVIPVIEDRENYNNEYTSVY